MTCALKASSADVFITKQAVEGQPDANPAFDRVRRTDGRVTQQNSFEKSSELKTNLQGQKNTLTDVQYNNTFNVEITQNVMLFAESVLMNNTNVGIDIEANTIAFDATLHQITDSANGFTDIVAGQWLFIKNASLEELNKPYYVTEKISDGVLQVVNVPTDLAAGDNIGLAANMLRSGNTAQLLTIQGRDPHTGATNGLDYKTQIDAVVDALNFAVPQTGLLTGSATVIAATQLEGLEPLAGQTDNPTDTSDVLGAAMDFAGFYPNQADVDNNFADVTIDIIRNTGTQSVAGKLGAKCVAQDVIGITGTLTSLRRADDPAQEESKFDNQERFSMSFGFEWPDGKFLMITMRQMIYTDGSIASASGEFANFAGTYDAEEDEYGTTIQFDTNITIDDSIVPTGVITTAVGTDSVPAVMTFSGDFKAGVNIQVSGTSDDGAWGDNYTLVDDFEDVQDFCTFYADRLKGNNLITANGVNNTIEMLGFNGGLNVTIDSLTVTP